MQSLKVLIACCLIFLVAACGEDDIPKGCDSSSEIVLTVEEAEGTIRKEGEYKVITYFPPGMIDSFWQGVVCNEDFPDFLITEDTQVRFSGYFRRSNDVSVLSKSQLAFGNANDVYALELTFIEEINGGQ